MRFPKSESVALYHLPTTGGASQAYPGTADVTTTGAVLPLDRRDLAIINVDVVEPWDVYLDAGVDVRLQDKVIIGSDSSHNYYVAHIFKANFGGLAHIRAVISKQQ